MDAAVALRLGIDAGSTTVKVVVVDGGGEVLRRSAKRHRGDLLGTTAALVREVLHGQETVRVACTGSGGLLIAEHAGIDRVHEVMAVSAAVERRHAGVRTIIDLGGQDAKLIALERDADGRVIDRFVSMNDRCAAGTGATLDRCLSRLGADFAQLASFGYDPTRVRTVAAKCGVFAESDVVQLARQGHDVSTIVVSLVDAIVVQNLSVLCRGRELKPSALLLGGPHAHLPALVGAWRHHLQRRWSGARGRQHPTDALHEPEVTCPPEAEFYAAIGAAVGVRAEHERSAALEVDTLASRLTSRAHERLVVPLDEPIVASRGSQPTPKRGPAQETSEAAIGLDVGSTRSKAVAVNARGDVLARAERPSRNPIDDLQSLVDDVQSQLVSRMESSRIVALGVTGYGASIAASLFDADSNVVETLAHARAARAVCTDVDVVCDVGGQDIKILALDRSGGIRDFRLSNQCNAGIGAILEATAREFDIALSQVGDAALRARRAPRFGEGCAVFLDADRVNFARHGFLPDEILAGLCRAIPRVVWDVIMHGSPPASLGSVFVLQGGLQNNVAAVEAQRAAIVQRVPGARVVVHPSPSDAGAIGAALCALDAVSTSSLRTIGKTLTASAETRVEMRTDDSMRCRLCANHCDRTLVQLSARSRAPTEFYVGQACDAGALTAPTSEGARQAAATRAARTVSTPDLLREEGRLLFSTQLASRHEPRAKRSSARPWVVGIPRVLSIYRAAPFFRGYFRAIGLGRDQIVFSPASSASLWRSGCGHSATDPCFPVKVVESHVDHLLAQHARGRRRISTLFLPYLVRAISPVRNTSDCASCPVVAASPALVRAWFSAARATHGATDVELADPVLDLTRADAVDETLHGLFGDRLGVERRVNRLAVEAGYAEMRAVDTRLAASAGAVLDAVARPRGPTTQPGRGAVLLLARPYHADPGVHHHLGEELAALGYPLLGIRSLPRDAHRVRAAFAASAERGGAEPFDIGDVLPDSPNSGANEQVWAARFAAAHGGLGVVDLTSFKCAQDASAAPAIDALLDRAGVPTCRLHDFDETKPVAAMRLRLRTFAHAMRARGLEPWSC